jgi:hypothetical protein
LSVNAATDPEREWAWGFQDLLLGEEDEQAKKRYNLRSAIICHGLVLAICEVITKAQGSIGVAVCEWQLRTGQSIGRGWKLVWESSDSQAGLERGSSFASQGFRILKAGAVDECWVAFADYVNNKGGTENSYGGIQCVLRAKRTGTDLWTIDAVSEVFTLPAMSFGTNGLHAHPPYVERYGSAGLVLACPIGDGGGNNRVAVGSVANQADFANPNAWAFRDDLHGDHGVFEATLPRREGNQFIANRSVNAAGATPANVLGGDESLVPVQSTGPMPIGATKRPNFLARYFQTCAQINRDARPTGLVSGGGNYVFNCFYMDRKDPLNADQPLLAVMTPGNQPAPSGALAWNRTDSVTRYLLSFDNGETWGQAWAPASADSDAVVFFGSQIVAATRARQANEPPIRVSRGTLAAPIPAWRKAKPLIVGAGGRNRLLTTVALATGSVGSGNEVTLQSDPASLPGGAPKPPCLGTIFDVSSPEGTVGSVDLGTFALTGSDANELLPANAKIKLKFWVYPLPWEEGTQPVASSLLLDLSVGRYEVEPGSGLETIGFSRERFALGPLESVGEPSRGWFPFTVDTDTAEWANDQQLERVRSPPVAPFRFGLRLRSRNGVPETGYPTGFPPNPCRFLLAFDAVLAASDPVEHTGLALPVGTTTAWGAEQASVSGFTCGNSWTIQLAGEIAHDAWDQTDTRRPTTPLIIATLWENEDSFIEIEAVPALRAIRFHATTPGIGPVSVIAPAPEAFFFLRGSPVLLAVACSTTASGVEYRFSVSVGGAQVGAASGFAPAGPTTIPVRPVQVRYANFDFSSVAPMLWYGGRVNDSTAESFEELAESLQSLSFLPST